MLDFISQLLSFKVWTELLQMKPCCEIKVKRHLGIPTISLGEDYSSSLLNFIALGLMTVFRNMQGISVKEIQMCWDTGDDILVHSSVLSKGVRNKSGKKKDDSRFCRVLGLFYKIHGGNREHAVIPYRKKVCCFSTWPDSILCSSFIKRE